MLTNNFNSQDFEKAIAFTLKWEGGLVNHPSDPGGLTNFGISKKGFPHMSDDQIKNLTIAEAKALYKRNYWDVGHCNDLPWPVNFVHFDTSVNRGVHGAAILLQKALGVKQDGIIGPKTLEAVKKPKLTAYAYLAAREEYYRDLAMDAPKFKVFLSGWMNRTHALMKEIQND